VKLFGLLPPSGDEGAGRSEDRLFEGDRGALLERVRGMAAAVDRALVRALEALTRRDDGAARDVIAGDGEIDALEMEIEQECLRLLALRRPVREELRLVFSVLMAITDLERMGDQAVNVAENALSCNRAPLFKPLVDIPRMAELARSMLSRAIEALVGGDADQAAAVLQDDDQVDDLNRKVFEETVRLLAGSRFDEDRTRQATDLMLVARHLERFADHATNLAERAWFVARGTRLREGPPPEAR